MLLPREWTTDYIWQCKWPLPITTLRLASHANIYNLLRGHMVLIVTIDGAKYMVSIISRMI